MLVEVHGAEGARKAASQGAEGLVVRTPIADVAGVGQLPVLMYGPSLESATDSSADALVINASDDGADLARLAEQAAEAGLECVLKVRDEDDLERALEHLDPEIFLLTAEGADKEEHLARLLGLLPDIPAGKLAIAELADASRSEIEALERAGIDAVLVQAGDVEQLVGDSPPEV